MPDLHTYLDCWRVGWQGGLKVRLPRTPYYPQSNSRIERIVGTIKTMLKRAVQEAVEVEGAVTAQKDSDNILGIGTIIDAEVIEKIREGEAERVVIVEDIDDKPIETKKAYWAPLTVSIVGLPLHTTYGHWLFSCNAYIWHGASHAFRTTSHTYNR